MAEKAAVRLCDVDVAWIDCDLCGPDQLLCDLEAGHDGCHETAQVHFPGGGARVRLEEDGSATEFRTDT